MQLGKFVMKSNEAYAVNMKKRHDPKKSLDIIVISQLKILYIQASGMITINSTTRFVDTIKVILQTE